MSFLRRVKSFSVKKYRSTDELKAESVNFRASPRLRRRGLTKEKSFSMEDVPLRLKIESNELFIRQKTKLEERESLKGTGNRAVPVKQKSEEKCEEARRVVKNGRLRKRKSVSFDETQFSRCMEEFVQLRSTRDGQGGRRRDRSRYKTVDVVNDLINEFDDGTKDEGAESCSNKPGNFPVFEEDEVQIRQPRNFKPERPKTYSTSPVIKKKEDSLLFRGVSRLEIDKDLCVMVRNKEILRLQDGYLQLVDDRGNTRATIRNSLSLKKGVKTISKKELEMIDDANKIYRLHFLSSKDAKVFVEIERSYNLGTSSSAFRNLGPWSQLRKLLKKRSSRDILESKGIIKNEPIFGNTLEELCNADNPVPEVITRIVKLIEQEENITSLGLYRASANLAIVQNIRFEINCGRWEILERHRKDVDVLAGTLKLFFRELKHPLISYEIYQQLHRVITNPSSTKDADISAIIESLPPPNKETLRCVMRHLLIVCRHKEANKMDIHNISICWGPSLITLPEHCVDLVTQTTEFTRITEDLLNYYSRIENLNEVPKIPDFVYLVVRKLTETIERSIETEGIYRKSGSNTKIDRIMKQLEKQNLGDLDTSKNDIHDLCCVLKKYMASLRESVVPDDFFHRYCDICDKVEDGVLKHEVRRMVEQLPRKDVVLVLFEHLSKVVSHERKNKMTVSVLSDIWMTTLMANSSVQNYKKKMPKYSKLFLILMNLNEKVLPDLVAEPKMRAYSKYENVPDDIHNESETFGDNVSTKL